MNIQEIRTEFSRNIAGIVSPYHEHLDKITAQREPGDGVYLDRLNDEQRMSLLREQKIEQASEITEQAREDYIVEVERYHTALSRRTEYLQERLFKVEDAGALSRAALASDAELGTMLDIASRAGNKELAKAVFVAAEQRDLGEHMHRYFEQVNPEGRDLYAEWSQLPPTEVLARQLDTDAILPEPSPDSLMPRATVL